MRKEVQYLGHLVSAEGIRTDPAKVDKVQDWPQPTSRKFAVSGLRRIL